MNRLSGAVATLAALLCALLGAALLVPATASAATPAKPKAGQCHDLRGHAVGKVSDTKKAVPCSKKHTTQTFAVVAPTAPLAGASELEIGAIGSASCAPAWKRFVQGKEMTAARTVLGMYFFTPTPAQQAAGQSWVRCDAGLMGKGGSMARTQGKLKVKTILRQSRSAKYALCGTKNLDWTTCTSRHAYRNTTVVKLTAAAGATYPTDDAFMEEAYRHCPTTTDYVTWVSEDAWAMGARQLRCWKKD